VVALPDPYDTLKDKSLSLHFINLLGYDGISNSILPPDVKADPFCGLIASC
jgi:hypothetical protein